MFYFRFWLNERKEKIGRSFSSFSSSSFFSLSLVLLSRGPCIPWEVKSSEVKEIGGKDVMSCGEKGEEQEEKEGERGTSTKTK